MSLNSFCPTTKRFRFRTVREEPARSLLPQGGKEELVAAAQKATAADSFIVPLDRSPRFLIGNAVLNAISQQFSAATLKADILGSAGPAAVHCAPYVAVLTSEPVGVARMSKVRVMLTKRDTMLAMAELPERPRVRLVGPNLSMGNGYSSSGMASGSDADRADVELEEHWHMQRYRLMRELAIRYAVDAQLTDREEDSLPHEVRMKRFEKIRVLPEGSDQLNGMLRESPFIQFELCTELSGVRPR